MAGSPNILVILTDQQRFDTLAAYGNRICQTPATDRLAREGMTFIHAFTPTSLCSPARASLLTGLYSHNHTMTDLTNTRIPSIKELPGHLTSFATLLQRAGYDTGYVGKWHCGASSSPLDWGFDEYQPGEGWHEWRPAGVELENESAIRLGYDRSRPMAARVACPLEEYPELGRTDAAIDFLERQVASEGSFFLQLNYFGPHYPHYLPEPYHSMYDPLDIPACPNFKARSTTPHYGDRWLRQRWSPDTDEWAPYAEIVAAQYGQVTLLEHEIQRVLDALDRLQLADGTLVIFASDHGELAGAHGLMQKGAVAYDELYRVPLIARWPGVIDPGSSCDSMVNLFDLMPTILEAACCQPPDDIDARSLLPLLEGQSPADWPEQVFCEYLATQAGDMALKILRTRTHKLAVNLSDGDELYDLEDDPGETKNRIGQPSCAPVLKDLARRLDTEMRRTHDPLAPRFQRRMAPYLRVADGRGTTGNSPSPG